MRLVVLLGLGFAGLAYAQNEIFLLGTISCKQRVQRHGFMPSEHHEEGFSRRNVVATDILADNTHITRLIQVMETIHEHWKHANHRAGLAMHLDLSVKEMILVGWGDHQAIYGANYVEAAYGKSLPALLDREGGPAKRSLAAMPKLEAVLHRLAWSIKYLAQLRHVWMDIETKNGNANLWKWYATHKEEENFPERWSDLCSHTEGILRPRSPYYRAALGTASFPLDQWEKRFPTQHLPEITVRALAYLRENVSTLGLAHRPFVVAMLEGLSEAVIEFSNSVD